jgi:hypothetical protein
MTHWLVGLTRYISERRTTESDEEEHFHLRTDDGRGRTVFCPCVTNSSSKALKAWLSSICEIRFQKSPFPPATVMDFLLPFVSGQNRNFTALSHMTKKRRFIPLAQASRKIAIDRAFQWWRWPP